MIKIFTGSEVAVILLKGELEANGISFLIKNDFQSGISAGFGGGTPSSIDLYVQEDDFEKAEAIVIKFMKEE